MIKLTNAKRGYELNLPTKFSEIDFNELKKVLDNVDISEHYAVVALCQSFSTFQLATIGAKNSKDMNVPVSINFIAANDPNGKLKANPGDKVITSRSDIEMSVHLPITFGLSTSSIAATIEDNPEVRTALRSGINDEEGNVVKEVVAVEFKLVPLTAIKATIDRSRSFVDIYRTTISK